MGFHFDPIKDEFVLIRAVLALIPQPYPDYSSTSHMEIFSSAIGIWEKCVPTDLDFYFRMRPFEYATLVNGVFYWLELDNGLLAYEYGSRLCRFIPLPEPDPEEGSIILGVSKDGLLQYGRSYYINIKVWVLENSRSTSPTWIMTHDVSLEPLFPLYPDLFSSYNFIINLEHNSYEWYAQSQTPLLVAFHIPDIVFLRLGNRIMAYHLVQQKLELVMLQGNTEIIARGQESRRYYRHYYRLPSQADFLKIFPFFSPTWAACHL